MDSASRTGAGSQRDAGRRDTRPTHRRDSQETFHPSQLTFLNSTAGALLITLEPLSPLIFSRFGTTTLTLLQHFHLSANPDRLFQTCYNYPVTIDDVYADLKKRSFKR